MFNSLPNDKILDCDSKAEVCFDQLIYNKYVYL